MTLKRYRQLAIVTTLGVCVLTVAGAVVRLTGSGLGCADWPACNTERFIDVSTGHTAIEQLNRLLSGLIGVPTLLLAIVAFRAAPRGNGLRWPALGVLISVLANGVVGGIAVMTELHPALVQSHFLLAMVSIAFGMVAIHVGSGRSLQAPNSLMIALCASMAVAVTTGTVVTGTGPHAGDETARRFGFDISDVARVHSVSVLVTIAVGLYVARRLKHHPAMQSWMFVAVLQGAIGYVQYFTGVPEILVGLHIAGATLLWVATLRLALAPIDVTGKIAAEGFFVPTQSRV